MARIKLEVHDDGSTDFVVVFQNDVNQLPDDAQSEGAMLTQLLLHKNQGDIVITRVAAVPGESSPNDPCGEIRIPFTPIPPGPPAP